MNSTDKEIKLLLVLPFFYPHRGGSQKYAEELYARMMQKHSNFKVDVLCYNTDHVRKFEEYRGFRIYRVDCWNILPARFALAYPWQIIPALFKLAKNKYNFVNTHIRFFDTTWWLWIYAKIIGAKSIFTGHVATHPVHQNKLVEIIGKTADLTIAAFSLKFYDIITFTNKTAQKFFWDKLGVRRDTFLIYGGIDTKFFSPGPKTNRMVPKINKTVADDQILIAYAGRFIWTKGITYLYDSAKQILSFHPLKEKIVFVFAGPGELENQIRNQISNDGLTDKILMTGDLKYEQVRDLLSIADIFINPSHHNEGFPNTVLEGGSAGCYVIATDNAGTWEVVRNGETGQLIPQKDSKSLTEAIVWALDNKEVRENIAKRFRQELIAAFDWDVISEQLYDILKTRS